MGREWAWAAALLVLLAGVVGGGYWLLPKLQGGGEAPPFTVTDLDNVTHNLTDYRGQVVVLDFMATWCGACKIVQRNLADVREEQPDLVVLSIDIDTGETRGQLEEYRQRTNLTWPLAWDTDGLARKYAVFAIPKVVVIDPQGVLARQWEGLFTPQNPGAGSSLEVVTAAQLRDAVADARAGAGDAAPAEPPLRVGLVTLALLGGAFSFFAPCAFPLLPAYMGYFLNLETRTHPDAMATRRGRLRRGAQAGLAAGAGVLTVYGLIGVLIWGVGQPIKQNLSLLQPAIGAVAVVLGVAMVAGWDLSALVRPLTRLGHRVQAGSALGPGRTDMLKVYGFGAGYGAVASSCTAPFFLSLFVAGFLAGPATGLRVFLAYASAAAFLMVLVTLAVAASRDTLLRGLARRTRAIQVVSGAVLVGAGAYLVWFYANAYGF